MRRNSSGFTLTEIATVTFIVCVLLSVAMMVGLKYKKIANETNCQANLKGIGTAFEIYASKNSGSYAAPGETSLEFLIDAACLHYNLIGREMGGFRYEIGSLGPEGYDVRAMALSPAMADHNYQIVTSGLLKRSDTASSQDTNFKTY